MNDDSMHPPDETRTAIRAWLDALPRRQGAAAMPEVDELAGWVEGTLTPDRRERVEQALAREPALRHALTALAWRSEEPVPADELARLDGLVPGTLAEVVTFPAPPAPISPVAFWMAAAVAAALLVPAWTLGTKIAEQRTASETRELREYLRSDQTKGGL